MLAPEVLALEEVDEATLYAGTKVDGVLEEATEAAAGVSGVDDDPERYVAAYVSVLGVPVVVLDNGVAV